MQQLCTCSMTTVSRQNFLSMQLLCVTFWRLETIHKQFHSFYYALFLTYSIFLCYYLLLAEPLRRILPILIRIIFSCFHILCIHACMYVCVCVSAICYTSHFFSNRFQSSFVYTHPTLTPFNAVTLAAACLRVYSLLYTYICICVCMYIGK